MIDYFNGTYTDLGDEDHVCEQGVEALFQSAIEYRNSGDEQKSIETVQHAVEISIARHGEMSKSTARCLFIFAHLLENFDRSVEAIQVKIRLQAIESDLYGENHEERINTINNIALAYEKMGEDELADMCYRWALKAAGELEYQHVLIYCNYGKFLRSNSREGEALIAFQRVLDLVGAEEPCSDSLSLGSSYQGIAHILKSRGEFEKAEDYYKRSIEVNEKDGLKREASVSHHNLGYYYFEKGKLDRALEHFLLSLEHLRDDKYTTELAILSIYFTQGKHEAAHQLSNEIVDRLIKKIDPDHLGFFFRNIYEILELLFDNGFLSAADLLFGRVKETILQYHVEAETESVNFCSDVIFLHKKFNQWDQATDIARLMLNWLDLMEEEHYDYERKLLICGECMIKAQDFNGFETFFIERLSNLTEEMEWFKDDIANLWLSYQVEKGNFTELVEAIRNS